MIILTAIGLLLLGSDVAEQAPAAWQTTMSYNMASSADGNLPKYEMNLLVDSYQSGRVVSIDVENRLHFEISRCQGNPVSLNISVGASSSLPLVAQVAKFREISGLISDLQAKCELSPTVIFDASFFTAFSEMSEGNACYRAAGEKWTEKCGSLNIKKRSQ